MQDGSTSYSEPTLVTERYPSPSHGGSAKRDPLAGGPPKVGVSIVAPSSPTSTKAPSPTHAAELSGSWSGSGTQWLGKHLDALRDDTAAARLDCEPNPAFPLPPQGRASPVNDSTQEVEDRHREQREHKIDLLLKDAELQDTRKRLQEALAGLGEVCLERDAEVQANRELRITAAEARGEAAEAREALRERDTELDSVRLLLRGARNSAKRQDEQLLEKDATIEALRKELSAARACAMSNEQLQAKDAELSRLRQELQDALTCSLARRSAHKDELKTKEAELATVRRELRDALDDATISRGASAQAQKLLDAKESEVSGIRGELREALRDGASARELLMNERARVRELEGRLEGLQTGEAALQRALDAERRESSELRQRVASFQAQLQTASCKEENLVREAELLRSRGDHQELVSHKLRLDLQEAMSASPDMKPTLKSSYDWGGATLQSARTIVPPVPHPPPPLLTSARRDYPSSSVSRRLRKEVLSARRPTVSDRTLASSRYDSRGRLISFDAAGRAVP